MDAFDNFDMAVKVENAVNSVNVIEPSLPTPDVAMVPSLVPIVTSVQIPKGSEIRGIRLPPLFPKKSPNLKMDVKIDSAPEIKLQDVKLLDKVDKMDPKLDTNTLKLKPLSSWKNTTMYKGLLVFFAFVVFLYLSKKYWWNYVVKRFFPNDKTKEDKSDTTVVTKLDSITDLKEKDVKEALGPSPHAKVILIFATWCGHCKTMMKDFEEAATHVSKAQMKHKVVFLRAEASECPSISNRPSVPGFPTIVGIFQNGTEFPYAGPRTKDSFVKFAELIAIGGLDVVSSSVESKGDANGTGLVVEAPKLKPRKLASFYETPSTPQPQFEVKEVQQKVQEEQREDDFLKRVPTATEDLIDKDETVIDTPLGAETHLEAPLETLESTLESVVLETQPEEVLDTTTPLLPLLPPLLPNTPLQSTGTVETHSRTRKSKKEIKL